LDKQATQSFSLYAGGIKYLIKTLKTGLAGHKRGGRCHFIQNQARISWISRIESYSLSAPVSGIKPLSCILRPESRRAFRATGDGGAESWGRDDAELCRFFLGRILFLKIAALFN